MGNEQELDIVHVQYNKHETICKQNTLVRHAHVLTHGSAKMFIDGINNKNIIINILLPSNYIGLMAVYGSLYYPYSVSALSTCQVCQIDLGFVKTLYANNHNFMSKMNQSFGHSVSTIMKKLVSLNQKQIRGKVAESLLYLACIYDTDKFTLTITRKELGELSAITEENTVRVLTEFKNEGIIEIVGREIELKDKALLEKISTIG
jgi:CRP/FNR family transcriptional regulator, polysaccharide utilization system transcription regulator